MDLDELFQLKAAALLHDPPNKAWLIASGRAHEEEVNEFSKILFEDTVLQDAIKKLETNNIKNADRLAAGVDRWLLSILGGDKKGAFYYGKVKIKNCFDPRLSVELGEEPKNIDNFFSSLHEIIAKAKNSKVAWHLLYSLYELLWIEHSFASGPADTRIPTHNVFDHCYATVAVTNWYMRSTNPKGILVTIDIAGVQSFISEARKLRDFWAASYMVSSLMWSILWPFIEKLGPDILIKPTCRDNPFYYHSLFSMLKDNGVEGDFINKFGKLCKKFIGYDPQEDIYPHFAVIPEKATLILPDFDVLNKLFGETFKDEEDLKKFIESRYLANWQQIYETIIECIKFDKSLNELRELAKLLDEWRKYGFDRIPPLPLRIASVTVDEVKVDIRHDFELYDTMNRRLSDKLREQAELKFRPEIELELTKLTESGQEFGWPEVSERAFDYCTVCGRLVAMFRVPTEESTKAEYVKKLVKESMEIYFSPGEKLCPYCLIKRLFANYADELLEKLLGKVSKGTFRSIFPSVSDVASIEFKELIIEEIKEKCGKDPQRGFEILTRLEKLTSSMKDVRLILTQELWSAQQELVKTISRIDACRDKVVPLYSLVYGSAELLYFQGENERRMWHNFIEESFGKEFPMRIYYSLIKSDADNMGKLIFGDVEEALHMKIDEYFKNLLEGDAKEVLAKIISAILKEKEGDSEYLKEAEKIIRKHVGDEAEKRVKETKDFLEKLIAHAHLKRLIVTPSYHVLISRALMRTAIRDVKIASGHKGVVVYTGGDDLFMLAPVSETLPIIYETRKSFSLGSNENPGFEKVGKGDYYIPSLISVGRSYSVNITHYMYPLYLAIRKTIDNLELYAKGSEWISERTGFAFKKDTLILCYSARGGSGRTSLLPLIVKASEVGNVENLVESINELIELVEDIEERRVFTTSLIYDLETEKKLIEELLRTNALDMLEKMFTSVFERNIMKEREDEKVGKYVDYLIRKGDLKVSYDSKNVYFITEFLNGLQIIRNGFRSGP